MQLESSRQISEKYSNIKFMKIRQVAAELLHAQEETDGRTDRQTEHKHDEANSRSSQFCERNLKWDSLSGTT
jgi:hypothetical protein